MYHVQCIMHWKIQTFFCLVFLKYYVFVQWRWNFSCYVSDYNSLFNDFTINTSCSFRLFLKKMTQNPFFSMSTTVEDGKYKMAWGKMFCHTIVWYSIHYSVLNFTIQNLIQPMEHMFQKKNLLKQFPGTCRSPNQLLFAWPLTMKIHTWSVMQGNMKCTFQFSVLLWPNIYSLLQKTLSREIYRL